MESKKEKDSRYVDIVDVDRIAEDYISAFSNLSTDGLYSIQKKKIRQDQVKNNAGGWVFKVSDEMRVRRFLILGTTSPTYYSSAKALTMQNLEEMIDIINNGNAALILKEILQISLAGRNPKQEPVMIALALCARYRVDDFVHLAKDQSPKIKKYMEYLKAMHKGAISIVNDVCRIPTHLFMFIQYCQDVSKHTNRHGTGKSTGWGRLMRACINNWYAEKAPKELAMHLTKYPQRNGWSHTDLFRLGHPKAMKNVYAKEHLLEIEQLYSYAVTRELKTRKLKLTDEEFEIEKPDSKYTKQQMENERDSPALTLIQVYKYINQYTSEEDIIYAIRNHKLVREHIPTNHLNSPGVWRALVSYMPMTALIRNLGKMTNIGTFDSDYLGVTVSQLTDEDKIRKSRIHPFTILLAKTTYQHGRGDKGSLCWIPNPKIDEALEKAFYLSFFNAPPTGKRICFAYDVSGSMTSNIAGTHLSCRTASAALSLITLKTENNKRNRCIGFSHTIVDLPYDENWTIERIEKHMNRIPCGATDCAQPMIWATRRNLKFDVFIVYTDNETYFGKVHPFQALQRYRKTSGIPDAKLIVIGMTATKFTIADPTDSGMLDIVGLDSAVPQLIYEFITGQM